MSRVLPVLQVRRRPSPAFEMVSVRAVLGQGCCKHFSESRARRTERLFRKTNTPGDSPKAGERWRCQSRGRASAPLWQRHIMLLFAPGRGTSA